MVEETCIRSVRELTKQHLSVLSQQEEIRVDDSCYRGEEIENKETIVKYFASVKPQLFTTMKVKDKVSGDEVKYLCNNRYFDDLFYWTESDIYHFVKYNMPLKQGFIDYVVSMKN